MIVADTPNLWEIRQNIGKVKVQALVVYALACIAELVNIERNLTEPQMMQIAEDVVSDYGYMKLEEVKYVLKNAVRTKKIFARLDYNVVMDWFAEYASERVEHCENISHNEDMTRRESASKPDENAISFDSYVKQLEAKAEKGDEAAIKRLSEIKAIETDSGKYQTREQAYEDKLAFKRFFFKYIRNKK